MTTTFHTVFIIGKIMLSNLKITRDQYGNIERFSIDCRKTKTKAITPTNHNWSKQRDEPITIPSNYL